jgi:hypothetical protein
MGGLKDYPTFPAGGNINKPDCRRWSAEIPIGASGATGTILNAPAGFACAKSATGRYACTGVPTYAAGKGRFWFSLKSASPTVGAAVVRANDGAAGTMSFSTVVGATETEPASGDVVWVHFEGEPL